jgi:transcriptional regulator with XRE-family HTH domain
MPLQTTPHVVRRYMAYELRRLRLAAGLGQPDVARHLSTKQNRVSGWEQARTLPWPVELAALLELYGAPELTAELTELIRQVRTAAPSQFELQPTADLSAEFDLFIGLEQGAQSIAAFDCTAVNGLLQTRAYAMALAAVEPWSAEEADRRVGLRIARQSVLTRQDPPPVQLTELIDESVLFRAIGGVTALTGQLDHLMATADRSNVHIRVVPYSAGAHRALNGPFIKLVFPISRDPGVIFLEDRLGGRYRDSVEDVAEYTAVVDQLLDLALSESDSVRAIEAAKREIEK